MERYTIRRRGVILGTYAGADEKDALDAMSRDDRLAGEKRFRDFDESCKQLGLRRDDYTLEPAED